MSTRSELILQRWLGQLMTHHGQSLHLTAGQPPTMRLDDELQPLTGETALIEDVILETAKALLTGKEYTALQELRSLITVKEVAPAGRFRLNCYYQKGSLALTFKQLANKVPAIKDLKLPPAVEKLSQLRKGLLIISGPYDSGRSTLAMSLLELILANRPVRLMTLEQPLEYLIVNSRGYVEQRQVGQDVTSFEDGLKMLLEEDVEIVFVSAVTSLVAASTILQLALSEHLVIVILTSDSAVRAVEQFLALATDEAAGQRLAGDLAEALRAIINLRLLPGHGHTGRVTAVEILLNTPAIKSALKEKDYLRLLNILQISRQEGMQTLDQSLLSLVEKGEISKETALAAAAKPDRLSGLFER